MVIYLVSNTPVIQECLFIKEVFSFNNIYFTKLLVDGRKETVQFDKITSRITKLCYNLDMNFVDPASIGKL